MLDSIEMGKHTEICIIINFAGLISLDGSIILNKFGFYKQNNSHLNVRFN